MKVLRKIGAKIYHSCIVIGALIARSYFFHKLKNKDVIQVVFLVSENQKWNCDSLYLELEGRVGFKPKIAITKLERASLINHHENLKFFTDRGYDVINAYDEVKNVGVELTKLNADVIFAQQPGGLIQNQGLISLFLSGLICYVPYGLMVANNNNNHYNLVFNKILWKYFAPNKIIKELYLETSKWTNENKIIVTGHPKLDNFQLKKKLPSAVNKAKSKGSKIIIYAPHHSVEATNSLQYATFLWNGIEMLDYAKSSSEIYFVFKPHPRLKHALIKNNIMSKSETERYYSEWSCLDNAEVYNAGDYLDLFNSSDILITDCGSFLAEYLLTRNPVIVPINPMSKGYNRFGNKLVENYYKVDDFDELKKTLKSLLDGSDPLKLNRENIIQELFLENDKAGYNIAEYLQDQLSKS